MLKYTVKTTQDAISYLAECLLATVSDLAIKKSKTKSEYTRHIEIAQTAVTWLTSFKIESGGPRSTEVLTRYDGRVEDWAKSKELK